MNLLDLEAVYSLLWPKARKSPGSHYKTAQEWNLAHPTLKDWNSRSDTDRILSLSVHYFTEKYPEAPHVAIAMAATFVSGESTGLWGGWGQDQDPRYEDLQNLLLAFSGGSPGAIFSLTPPEKDGAFQVPGGQPDFTLAAIEVIEAFLFDEPEQGVSVAFDFLHKNRDDDKAVRSWRIMEAIYGPSKLSLNRNVTELCETLGVKQSWIYTIARDLGVGQKIGGITLFTPEDVKQIKGKIRRKK